MRLIWTFILLILLSLEPGTVQAHPQFALSTVNRYGRLVLLPHRLILDYSLMIGEIPAQAHKRAADRNEDGQLDEAEQAQLRTLLQRTIERDVHLQLDGKPLSLRWSCQPLALRSTRMEAAPFALEMSAEAELDNTPQPHQLIIDDRADLPPVGEVELRVEESPFLNILLTHAGSTTASQDSAKSAPDPVIGPARVQLLFRQFGPPRSLLSDRSVTIHFQRRQTESVQRPKPWRYLAIVTALLTLIGVAFATRRILQK